MQEGEVCQATAKPQQLGNNISPHMPVFLMSLNKSRDSLHTEPKHITVCEGMKNDFQSYSFGAQWK